MEKKTILILITYTIIFLTTIQPYIIENWEQTDANRHYNKAQNCNQPQKAGWTEKECQDYKPLLATITWPFTQNPWTYTLTMHILIGIITPLTLYYLTNKHWTTILFYYTTTSYYYYHIDGIYAQALTTTLAIILITTQKWKITIPTTILMTLAHGHGLPLALLIITTKQLPQAILACTGTLGKYTPEALKTTIGTVGGINRTIENLIHPLTRITPLPFLLIALKQNHKDKKHYLNIIIIITLLASLTISIRTAYIATIPMIIGLTNYYQQTTHKKILLTTTIIWGIYQLYAYTNLKDCLGI